MIVDIDEGDLWGKLSFFLLSFLGYKFFLFVRIFFYVGGLFVMNVVFNGVELYCGVVFLLLFVFDDVYEIDVVGDVNCVVFVLMFKVIGVNVDGFLVCWVK